MKNKTQKLQWLVLQSQATHSAPSCHRQAFWAEGSPSSGPALCSTSVTASSILISPGIQDTEHPAHDQGCLIERCSPTQRHLGNTVQRKPPVFLVTISQIWGFGFSPFLTRCYSVSLCEGTDNCGAHCCTGVGMRRTGCLPRSALWKNVLKNIVVIKYNMPNRLRIITVNEKEVQ